MAVISLFNTLTRKKEVFKPLVEGKVGMYNCGPTVYDHAHIGNLRAYLFSDSLRRMFEFNNYTVNQIINITDIGHLTSDADDGDDKMVKALKREGKPMTLLGLKEVADIYTAFFEADLKKLNIEFPTTMPRASDHIEEDKALIQILLDKKFAYTIDDGVYFDTAAFKNYGVLGGLSNSIDDSLQSRIETNSEKRNARDFALWKRSTNDIGWPSPWGKGFPGWHIECSAMARKYLGQPFDVHTGGIDHIPIHHNNEIAQSEAAYDTELARCWLHNAHIVIKGGKMAKSSGNFITLDSLTEKNIAPLAYRYWLLTAHYRTQVNFTWEAVGAAQIALFKLYNHFSEYENSTRGEIEQKYLEQFVAAVNDDLDTPKAIALLWQLIKDKKVSGHDKKATLIEFDRVLGLGLSTFKPEKEKVEIPPEIYALAETREEARKEKDFAKADALRKEIEARGFEMEDTKEGMKIIQK